MVTTPCQIYILFNLIDLDLSNSMIFNIYKQNNKNIEEFAKDIFSIYKGEYFLEPFVEIDLFELSESSLLEYDVDLICLEMNKLLWNINYQKNNISIKNYILFDCFFIEPDTMIFEYRKVRKHEKNLHI